MMKQKKISEQEPKANELNPGTDKLAEDQAVPGSGAEESAEATVNAEEELKQKLNELNDKYLRLHAEFDNYRKRSMKERVDLIKTASEELIKELLPILDDFERAAKSIETSDSIEALKEGMNLIYNKLRNTLTCKGLQEIKTVGEDFNVDFQEAVAHIPAPEEELKNKVIDEVQKGYTLNDKVIRYAKVVVGS
jgi:molecular chaperone GrpE